MFIECKQSRADFLRDGKIGSALIIKRQALDLARQELEEKIIRTCEPHLRQNGASLFALLEPWDFSGTRLESYREVLAGLRALDKQIHGQTKFWAVARYALADVAFIAAPEGLIRPRELPPGWGLLEFPKGLLETGDPGEAQSAFALTVAAKELPTRDERRARLLRNIAAAASRIAVGSDFRLTRRSRQLPIAGTP